MSNPEYAIPAELQETLLDFTVHYLVERPPDIIDFAMDYFSNLHSKRNASQHHHSEDESMESEDDIDFGKYIFLHLSLKTGITKRVDIMNGLSNDLISCFQ